MPRNKNFVPADVLRKAMVLFWTKGYAATSMEDLVQTMGISRASLYATFGDKRQLFFQALEAYHEQQLRPQLDRMIASGNLLEALCDMITRQFQSEIPCADPDHPAIGCFLANCVTEISTSDPEIHARTQEIFAEIRMLFTQAITIEKQNHLWSDRIDPEAMAGLILITLMGLRVLHRSGSDLSFALQSLRLLR